MYELNVKAHFSSAHHLAGYSGACAHPHGHNWEVEVFLRGNDLNGIGLLVDFRTVKEALRKALGDLDHCDLNARPEFRGANPTSENVARFLFVLEP